VCKIVDLSYSTVSSVYAMLKRELDRDPKLRKRPEGVRRLPTDNYGHKATPIPNQFPIREGEAGNGLVGQGVGRFDESNVGEGVTARTSGVEQGCREAGRGVGEQSRTAWSSGNPLR